MKTLKLPIRDLDCSECAGHVKQAIEAVPGVAAVDILLPSQKALVHFVPVPLIECHPPPAAGKANKYNSLILYIDIFIYTQ